MLVTIDSLRADHVGAYGDAGAQTPSLDSLAAAGVRFEHAYAAAPLTVPSHASLLTGRYPPHHGVRIDAGHLDPATPTIAEVFRRGGFATAAFPGTPSLDGRTGLDRGFDSYAVGGSDADMAAWFNAQKDRRFFVWVHLFEPHAPYGNRPDRARVARAAIDRYHDGIAAADAQVARLVTALGSRRRETLIVVTSDNGEAFGEHGEITHGLFVYDTTLRVPLILSGPGIDRGLVVADPVSLVDVAPSLAAFAGLGPFESDGQVLTASHLRPAASDLGPPVSAPRTVYSETFAPLAEFGWSPLRAIRSGDWKFIAAPQPELYDLKNDSGETRNLVDDQPALAAQLAQAIAAVSPQDPATVGVRADPKDGREIAARIAEVTSGELKGPLLERALREIIRDDPGNAIANLRLGQILAASNRCGEALRRFRTAAAAHAPGDEAERGIARCGAKRLSPGSR